MSIPYLAVEKSCPSVAFWSDLPLIDRGPVLLDLSGINYVTAAGLTDLVRLRRRLPDAHIVLSNPSPLKLRVLTTVGFEKLFEIRTEDRTPQARTGAFKA